MKNTKRFLACFLWAVLAFGTCISADDVPSKAYLEEIQKWRDSRVERLKSEDGWLTLIGLYWLKPGENKMGSAGTNQIKLPARAPAYIGSFFMENGAVRFVAGAGADVRLEGKPIKSILMETDHSENTTVLHAGSIQFYIIQRTDKLGVRLKDKDSEARTHFTGIEYYPIDPKWRFQARFEKSEDKKSIPILNIVGLVEETPSPGSLVFDVAGKTQKLAALFSEGDSQMFIMFADQTSGKETYGAGRYMYVDPPGSDGTVDLDFNKAYNPPCAFTPFATCPLPPPQNRLSIAVTAGEKNYSGAHEPQ